MPYALPRDRGQQNIYNEQLQKAYTSTRRVAPPPQAAAPPRSWVVQLKELAQLHDTGALTDEEFAQAKATVLASEEGVS